MLRDASEPANNPRHVGNYRDAPITMGLQPNGPFTSYGTNLGLESNKQKPKTIQAISPRQAEYRVKNLCLFCHQEFSKDHKCPHRQQFQLHFIEHGLLGQGLDLEIKEKST